MNIKSVHGLKTVLLVMESCFTGQESHKVHSPSSFSALCVGSFKTFLSSLVEKIGSILPQKYQKCFFLLLHLLVRVFLEVLQHNVECWHIVVRPVSILDRDVRQHL